MLICVERELRRERESMDECLRRCKRSVREMGAVMEVDNGGVRTRGMEEVSSKRRKSNGLRLEKTTANLLLSGSSSPANSTTSWIYTVHEQSSDVVTNNLRSTDLKLEDSETESSTFTIGEFREISVSSELSRGESGEIMESTSTTKKPSPKNSHRKFSAAEMPSAAEIEEFFSMAEKYEQKRFIEKYNYDIVKDVPLEGRYQWVRLKP